MTSSARRPESVRIAVFAKAPVAGKVKTRLVPVLGPEGAARLHGELLRHALAVARDSGVGPVELWCTPDSSHPFLGRSAADFGATLHVQQGSDLGARMAHAFDAALGDNAALVMIGADCPALTPPLLRRAARLLASHDAVIAPAEDGGYVLVGLAAFAPGIFSGIAWGGTDVMEATRHRLEGAAIRWTEMETLWDIDRPEDYARLAATGLLGDALPR
jgi:rSAM/selenodomain-associated transferase 1